MGDIHSPSRSSEPASGRDSSTTMDSDKMLLMDLITEKQRVESELKELSHVLDTVCTNDMNGYIVADPLQTIAWCRYEH